MNFPTQYELSAEQQILMDDIQAYVNAWIKDDDESMKKNIEDVLDSFDYQVLPYACRNKPFISAHKLLKYKQNPIFAHYLYNLLIPSCKEGNAAFDVGTAVDRRLTYGDRDYQSRFIVKNRPPKDMQEEADKNHQIILSESEGKTVERCTDEYRSRHFFTERPIKKNLLCIINGLPCKAEMDHFDQDKAIIEDVKTCANINTFDHKWYTLQATFYYLLAIKDAEKTMEETAFETFRRKLTVSLCVVDKFTAFSRSHKYVYTNETLQNGVPEVMDLISDWKDSMESGIWANKLDFNNPEDLKTFFDSELYPHLKEFRDAMPPTYI